MGLIKFFRQKSPWMLLYNTGSCLPGNVELILGDGRMLRICELVEPHVKDKVANPHAAADVKEKILSWDGCSAAIKPLVMVHKLKSPEKLVEVEAGSGIPIRMTPDHKVLVDTASGPEWVEAGKLKVGDFLYSPRSIEIEAEVALDILDCLPPHYVAHLDRDARMDLKRALREKFGTLTKAAESLGVNRIRLCSSNRPLTIAELREISSCLGIDWQNLKRKIAKISGKNFQHELRRKKVDGHLMRLMGLIASDGFISITRAGGHAIYKVSFANKEPTLIDDFVQLCKLWLPHKNVAVRIDERNKVSIATIYSPLIAYVAARIGLKGIKDVADLRPILRFPKGFISSFLGGYFDGDGHVAVSKENDRTRIAIGFTVSEFKIAKQIHLLLKRLGIGSKVRRWTNKSSFGTGELCQVSITDPIDIARFAQQIAIKHPKKLQRLELAKELINKRRKRQSTIAYAPLKCGIIIRELRQKYRLTQSDISRWPAFLSMIERGRRIQKDTLAKLIDSLEGALRCDDGKLRELKLCTSDDYYLDRVRAVRWVDAGDQWVYNVTVDGTHSFIPEGAFVVKNCNGCDIEIIASMTPRYDPERFGMKLKGSPRHADILLVTGPVTRQSRERLLRIYEQMPEPKVVVAVGICPATNDVFDGCYNVVGPLDRHIPVDAYVLGCPPKPEAIIDAMMKAMRRFEG